MFSRVLPQLRISEAAARLGVSDDMFRRWAEHCRIALVKGGNGRSAVDGDDLAALARELADAPQPPAGARSTRKSLRGIVTKVARDTVMAQVEMQAGPFRVVSLMCPSGSPADRPRRCVVTSRSTPGTG